MEFTRISQLGNHTLTLGVSLNVLYIFITVDFERIYTPHTAYTEDLVNSGCSNKFQLPELKNEDQILNHGGYYYQVLANMGRLF